VRARLLVLASSRAQFVHFHVHAWQWAALVGLVAVLVLGDLFVLHREEREIPLRVAAIESAVWVALGLSFSLVILLWQGASAAGEYLSGYLIEESLSVDNVFVWAVILTFFAVPERYRFRCLFWGIVGALVLRAAFIFAGVALVDRFDFILYGFGAFLLYTAWKIARHDEAEVEPDENLAMRLVRRVVPSTTAYDGQRLFTKEAGKRLATPLFAVVVMIATTDVLFAFDSIPAILAVSREQFIVVSSNAFAILGLRSLYFCLQHMAGRFRYLNIGLGVILAFVGTKMLIAELWHVPTWLSLAVIAVALGAAVVASIRADARDPETIDDLTREIVEE
jgi:tellurite resistance protein TerC